MDLLRTIPMLIGFGIALASMAPVLLYVCLGTSAVALAGWFLSGQVHWAKLREQTRERRLTEYFAGLLTGRDAAKEIRLYGLAGHMLDRWDQLFWQVATQRRRLLTKLVVRQRAIILVSDIVTLAALLLVVGSGLIAGATPGQYALLFQSIHGLLQSAFQMSSTVQGLGEQSGYASELRAFLQLEPAVTQVGAQPFPEPMAQAIRFEDVHFTYPGADRPVLAGVNLEIRAGETVALVGENGAGKSTLIKLLLGLYQPDSGRITVDGQDMRAIDAVLLRRAVSAVFQQYVRYQLTMGENVTLGRTEAMHDTARLTAAIAKSGADEVLAKLPDGADTLLGPEVGGVDLSGGQWQRIAIARGFFRDAQVVVLDEPTAALDPVAELQVFGQFVEMAAGRTAVLISHRLGMARLADRVIVLAHGRVVEQGSHSALLRADGEYANMFQAQARWYE